MSAAATTIAHEVPPQAGPRAFLHRLRQGDQIAHLITLTFAAVILLLTSMLVYELWINSHLSRTQFGWAFFWTKVWDPTLHLRSPGHLRRRARACRPPRIGQRNFSLRACSSKNQRHHFILD